MSILDDLKELNEQPKVRSWKWLRFWRNRSADKNLEASTDIEREPLMGRSDRASPPNDGLVIRRHSPMAESNANTVKAGFIKRLLRLLKAMGRDDG